MKVGLFVIKQSYLASNLQHLSTVVTCQLHFDLIYTLVYQMNRAAMALTAEEIDCAYLGVEITQPTVIEPSHFRQVLQTMKPSVSAKVI